MGLSLTEYYVQIFDPRTGLTLNDDTGRYTVMTINTATRPTIHSDRFGSVTITNSIGTMTDGVIQFWIAASVTSVDITVTTALGQSRFIRGLTPSEHKLSIDQEKREQVMVLPFNGEAADGVDFNQLHILPVGALVHDAQVNVITLTASEVLDLGLLTTDPNGFLAAAVLDAIAMVESGPVASTGSNDTFISTADTYGALLNGGVPNVVGTDVNTDTGMAVKKSFYVATARAVTTRQTNSITADGYVALFYSILPPHA